MSVSPWKVTSAEESRLVGRPSGLRVGAGGGSMALRPNATSASVDSRVVSTSSSALTSGSAKPNTSVAATCADAATARMCESEVPASQKQCR